jgi:uncharacterized membrane protein (UPF0136 family)
MNPPTLLRPLLTYGTFLILVGIVGFLNNPEKAKTALLSGGFFGALFIMWGLLSTKKAALAWKGAFGTVALVFIAFTWRASVGWLAVLNGNSEKLVAASLITAMWIGAIILAGVLWSRKSSAQSLHA